jgi:hypothetical protein
VFILLFAFIYKCVDRVLLNKADANISTFQHFYHLRQNSLDVIAVGNSRMYRTINPAIIWEEKGILLYDLGAGSQPFLYSYYYIKESLKYQQPRVIVLEISASTYNDLTHDIGVIYRNTVGLKISKDKIEAVKIISPDNYKNFLLGFPVYHSRKDITKGDFVYPYKNDAYPNGYPSGFAVTVNPFATPQVSDITDTEPIPEMQLDYLMKIIQLTKEHNVPLLLIAAPYVLSENHQKRFNSVRRIADENGIEFINYNLLYDELGFDFQTDLYDKSHLNTRGAAKVSKHLANVLAAKYGIEDKRQNPEYAEWNEWAREIMESIDQRVEKYDAELAAGKK